MRMDVRTFNYEEVIFMSTTAETAGAASGASAGASAGSWKRDADILRPLAKKCAEIASLPLMRERRRRMTENNDLAAGRPPVLIFELPWHELNADGKLDLICENGFARQLEWHLRSTLFQWEHFPGDMYVEPAYAIEKAISWTGFGLNVIEEARHTDENGGIYSHYYADQLANEGDVEKIKSPVITAFPEKDAENVALASELLGGALGVELRGYNLTFNPWDLITEYRGVTPVFVDLCDRPGHMHAIMDALTNASIASAEQMERLGLLECRNPYLHCTPSFTKAVPARPLGEGAPPRFSDIWLRATAQIFAEVSPAMHEEFDVQYCKRLADRCALTYYGCCEPLHNKIEMLKKNLGNLRKIGVTPWADEERCAEQIGCGYVFAKKPNPAHVAIKADPDVIRAETVKTIELCHKYGCPYEFALKDISTVSYKLENLSVWDKTVRETLDAYYGKQGV